MKKILLSFASILMAVGAMAQLSGTYTINGAQATGGTNYQTFSAAASALGSNGVSGPVTFNVMSGTYNESVNMPTSISGTSTSNTITFQSDASNTSNPVLTNSGNALRFSYTSVNNISFKELDIKSTGSAAVYVYSYNNSSSSNTNIKFEDCNLESPSSSSSSSSVVYIYSYYYGSAQDFEFDGCTLEGGYAGVYMYDAYYSQSSTLVVNDCEVTGGYRAGVYVYGWTAYPLVQVTNSVIHPANNTYSYPYGVYAYYGAAGCKISGNDILVNGTSGGYGIYGYYWQGSSSNNCEIINNLINVGESTDPYTQYGLLSSYGSYTKIYHNTVRITNSYQYSSAAYTYYSSSSYQGNEFKNNILVSESSGASTLYAYWYPGAMEADNNVYSSNGGSEIYNYDGYTGTTATTIANWQNGVSQDTASIGTYPLFISSTNLTPQSIQVNNNGAALGVLTDVYGATRSTTTPDPGAIEFIVPTNNAMPSDLVTPDAPLCDDDTTISIVLYNSGLAALTSCSISYAVNGGTPVGMAWTGNLASQTDTIVSVENSINFSNGDELKVWTSVPNGVQDSSAMLDTITLVLNSGLSGTYAIPGDYATLTDARDALVDAGVCDDVVFNIASGTYNEQVDFPAIAGVSQDATITFQSATGNMNDVEINWDAAGTGDNYVVKLSGSDWITFQNVKLKALDSYSYATVVMIEGGSDNNTFDNCWIKGNSANTTSTYRSTIWMTGSADNLTISNNRVEGGRSSIYMQGNTSDPSENLLLEDNMFEDANYYALYLYAIDGLEMHGNTVTNDSSMYYNNYGFYGVYMYAANNFNVTGNYVGTNQDNAWYYTFYMNNCIGQNNPRSQFANNCIFGGADGSSSYGYYTFYAYNSGIMDFHHNSITRQGGSGGTYYAAYFNGGGLISLKNNSLANLAGGYALFAPGGFAISESDNNNLYTESTSLVYYGSAAYNTLEDYQNASGFDMNSVVTDPNWETALTCITCNDTLSNAGDISSQVTSDIQGNARSVIASDIGAVEFVSPASFSLGDDDTICGDQFIVEAGPAQSVTWNVNNQTSTDPTVTLNANGQAETFTISVNITTEYCGSGSDNVVLRLIPDASLDSSMHLCADETAVLDPGGAANADFLWNTGETAASITIADAGSYSVTKMEEGCESSAWIDVTQSDAVQLVDQDACSDDLPLSVDATIANGTSYAWSGGSSLTTAVNELSDAGSYSVTATDSYGCTSSAEFDLTVLEEPEANISETHSGNAYFFDGTSSLYVSANTEYFWDLGYNGITDSTSNPTIVYPWSDPSNPVTYTVTLTIDNGCGVDVTTMEVTPDPVGIEDIAANGFELYPNPAQEMVNFVLGSAVSQAGTIQVMDVTGRVLNSQVLAAGQTKGEINLNGLAAGSYMVKLTIDGHSTVNTLVKQ